MIEIQGREGIYPRGQTMTELNRPVFDIFIVAGRARPGLVCPPLWMRALDRFILVHEAQFASSAKWTGIGRRSLKLGFQNAYSFFQSGDTLPEPPQISRATPDPIKSFLPKMSVDRCHHDG